MERNIIEEIKRIQTIIYGKNDILSEGIIDKILNKDNVKIDDPQKADFISSDVNEYFETLESASASGGLSQQRQGSMEYQKSVESLQIGLILLGYDLPVHGVDGLYGPETGAAVDRFKKSNNIASDNTNATSETINLLIKKLKERGIASEDLKKHVDVITTGGSKEMTDIDIMSDDGFSKYSEICQKYINTKQNLLNINGKMMATGAKQAYLKYKKYVPPQLALSQLTLEGGLGNNPNSTPIKTKNPFNVGNVDNGGKKYFDNVQGAINAYYNLIASKYLGRGKTASDLLANFTNKDGNRYASSNEYENRLNTIINNINAVNQSTV